MELIEIEAADIDGKKRGIINNNAPVANWLYAGGF